MTSMRTRALLLVACAALVAQEAPKKGIQTLGANFKFTEGPVWSRQGFLLFTDIPENKILRWAPGEQVETWRDETGGANGLTFDTQGRLYICEGGGRRVTRFDKKGRLEVLADKFEGKRFNAPNDIVVRRDGHVYFTDPAFGEAADTRELPFYGVYHLTPKGDLEVLAKPAGRPNGIALSPDGKILYVDNTDEKNVRAYDLDRAGKASNERILVSNIDGPPDGMKVDEKGNLYIAAKGIAIYSPEGKLLRTMEVAETPANCAFGGADFQTLFITSRTTVRFIHLDVKGSVQY